MLRHVCDAVEHLCVLTLDVPDLAGTVSVQQEQSELFWTMIIYILSYIYNNIYIIIVQILLTKAQSRRDTWASAPVQAKLLHGSLFSNGGGACNGGCSFRRGGVHHLHRHQHTPGDPGCPAATLLPLQVQLPEVCRGVSGGDCAQETGLRVVLTC